MTDDDREDMCQDLAAVVLKWRKKNLAAASCLSTVGMSLACREEISLSRMMRPITDVFMEELSATKAKKSPNL